MEGAWWPSCLFFPSLWQKSQMPLQSARRGGRGRNALLTCSVALLPFVSSPHKASDGKQLDDSWTSAGAPRPCLFLQNPWMGVSPPEASITPFSLSIISLIIIFLLPSSTVMMPDSTSWAPSISQESRFQTVELTPTVLKFSGFMIYSFKNKKLIIMLGEYFSQPASGGWRRSRKYGEGRNQWFKIWGPQDVKFWGPPPLGILCMVGPPPSLPPSLPSPWVWS